MGSRPPRRIPNPPFAHASQTPPELADIDFSQLNLKYPVINNHPQFDIPRNGWSPKPTTTPNLPFLVSRAGENHSFPVYTDYKNGRTRIMTVVSKISGDIEALRADMEKVVGNEVQIKSGKLIVQGHFRMRLKKYLLALGF
jgi:translation initiation factor 1 (eIF-1/SUI1)